MARDKQSCAFQASMARADFKMGSKANRKQTELKSTVVAEYPPKNVSCGCFPARFSQSAVTTSQCHCLTCLSLNSTFVCMSSAYSDNGLCSTALRKHQCAHCLCTFAAHSPMMTTCFGKRCLLIRNYRNTHANILIVYFTRRCPIQYHWTLKKLQPRSSATIVNRSSVYMPYASMYFPCRRLAPMLFSTCSRDSDSCVNLLLLFKLTTFQLYFTDRELFFLNIFSSGVFHRVECGADRAADSILSVA